MREPYIDRNIRFPKVLVAGYNIYEFGKVNQLMQIEEVRTFKTDKLFINEYKLTVNNFDNFFSIDNYASPFKNQDWLFQSFIVKDIDDNIIWEGIITDIKVNHQTKLATIIAQSILAKYFSYKINYVSSDWETGAEAFKNICDQIGFTNYNHKSVEDSIAYLEANSCYIKCRMNYDEGITFQQAVEKLAEYSGADCFVNKNEIYFKVWRAYTGGAVGGITENIILKLPEINILSSEIINEYRIGYENDNDIPATDTNSNNIGAISRTKFGIFELPEMDGKEGQILIKDKTSATFIGEIYINRTHKNLNTKPMPLRNMEIDLKYDYKYYLDINSYIKLNLVDESWTEKVFEITGTMIDYDKNLISLTCLEVD